MQRQWEYDRFGRPMLIVPEKLHAHIKVYVYLQDKLHWSVFRLLPYISKEKSTISFTFLHEFFNFILRYFGKKIRRYVPF